MTDKMKLSGADGLTAEPRQTAKPEQMTGTEIRELRYIHFDESGSEVTADTAKQQGQPETQKTVALTYPMMNSGRAM